MASARPARLAHRPTRTPSDTAGHFATVLVSDTILAIEFTDGHAQVIRRTTTQPVRTSKANGRGPLH